ncbi:peptidylprolyl isomerase [Candidatus Woesearchaeota archaeon]|nr:peptidylprolyl isomerase [Candidatus Woesearchaeota archaeon]
MTVKQGDKIKIEYTGTLEDGTVFDSSEKQGKPLEFEVGSKQIIPGFEKAMIGMKVDEEKEITLQPAEAYGEPKQELVKKVPVEQLPKEPAPQKGMVLAVQLPNGQKIPAKITEVGDKEATIDLNHPLAGKVLKFKVKIVGVNT